MTPTENPNSKLKLLTEADLRNLLSVSRSTIYRLVRAGVLPAGIRVGVRSVRWPLCTIQAWLEARERK